MEPYVYTSISSDIDQSKAFGDSERRSCGFGGFDTLARKKKKWDLIHEDTQTVAADLHIYSL